MLHVTLFVETYCELIFDEFGVQIMLGACICMCMCICVCGLLSECLYSN
jgi:hypothetical protein